MLTSHLLFTGGFNNPGRGGRGGGGMRGGKVIIEARKHKGE